MMIFIHEQRDTNGLTSENRELKLRLQALEQQAHLRDALNDALREEVQRLKRVTGEMPNMNVNTYGRQLFLSNPQNGQQSYSQSASDAQSQSSRSQTDSMDYI